MEGESRAKYCLERTHIHLDFFEAVWTMPYGRSFMCAAGPCSAHFHLQQKGAGRVTCLARDGSPMSSGLKPIFQLCLWDKKEKWGQR